MTAEEYIELREGRGATVRRVPGGGWMVTCPGHDDGKPSLSVTEGQDGRVLIHCHADCDTESVLAEDGLDWSDLFSDGSKRNDREEVAAYDYIDEDGELLFQCVRFFPKGFSQRRPDGRGGWIWNLKGVRRALYRLPKVIEAVQAGVTIYVPEGEKDVHAIERKGQVATCNPMGAGKGKWRQEYTETLRGADVVIVRDIDEPDPNTGSLPGLEHAANVGRALTGAARSVRIVEPIVGKDVSDHLAAGHGLDELREVRDAATSAGASTDEEPVEPLLGEIPAYPVEALPKEAQALVRYGERQGLPAALIGGAALAAIAAAIGGAVDIEVSASWHERANLWVSLLAPRGAGKSPALDMAFAPLREHDEHLEDDDEERAVLLGDLTLEALARSLNAVQGAAALDLDELAVLLRGMGEYKRGLGGDRGRFLGLWTGAPWRVARVGGKGGKKNEVNLRIARPTLVICGGLQSALHGLLGGEEDGMRPRWLPHLAPMPAPVVESGHAVDSLNAVAGWKELLDRLLDNRNRPATTRTLSTAAREAFGHHRSGWKAQAADRRETASTSAALVKADIQLMRTTLTLYEADSERLECVGQAHVECAAQVVNFSLGCWRALPEQGSLALTRRDEMLDRGIVKLMAWLEEHGGVATRRELQWAHVGGARTAAELNALLERYEAVYPGTSTTEMPPGGGTPTVVIRLPIRGRR